MTPLEQLGKAITDAGYTWTEEMLLAYTEALQSMSSPLNGDQVIKLWQQSNGHAMKFAALIESWHGLLPTIFKEGKDEVVRDNK
jgi:hypothetical protein